MITVEYLCHMILKLIEAGGFAGLRRTAEEDLTDYSDDVKDAVKKVFEAPQSTPPPATARDKEQHYLELEGKVIPVAGIKQDKELKTLIKKLHTNLAAQNR